MELTQHAFRGRETIPALAEVYPQLYLVPGETDEEVYRTVVLSGGEPPFRRLDHFRGSEGDSCLREETPAGPVPVITLPDRRDFELFLQIMACRCRPDPIPRTQGAAILDGVINWTRIRDHKAEYLRVHGGDADWAGEFQRFTADRANYKDALIVLSVGPYSAVPAEELGFSEAEWQRSSQIIRRTHECTHFLCRRLFPQQKEPVWDELVADAAGIFAAFGRFDPALAERFLGVTEDGYAGGRLENYVEAGEDRDGRLDALARKVHGTLTRFAEIAASLDGAGAYDLAVRLEEEFACWKQH